MGYAEMPTFKNQMQVKCKLNIAEWVTSWGLAGSKVGSKVKGQRPCKLTLFGP